MDLYNTTCIYLILKSLSQNIDFLLITNGLFVFLIPWWIGSLYGIGEIASMIVFTNAMFLFRDMRKLSIFLFAVSIIRKYLTLLGFIGFYFSKAFKERNILKVSRDFIYFSLPVIGWLKIVNSRYQEGNAFHILIIKLISFLDIRVLFKYKPHFLDNQYQLFQVQSL